MKKFFSLLLLTFFASLYCQSNFDKIDARYDAKLKEIKDRLPNPRNEERVLLFKNLLNERIKEYKEELKKIQISETKIDIDINNPIDEVPEFEKGISGFRQLFAENFNTDLISDSEGTVRSKVKFIVDENGKVSNVTAEGTDEELNFLSIITIYRIRDLGVWKPARKNDKSTEAVFILPIAMNFE